MEQLDQEGGADCRSEGYEATGADAWRHAERLHDEFDRLAGSSPGQHQRVDRVPDQVFSKLVRLLDDPAIGKTRALANKRVAHAADPMSRQVSKHGVTGIGFNEIESAHHSLITAAEFVSRVLLSHASLGPVPIPQFDPFEHLEAGGLRAHDITRLSRLADSLAGRHERWAREAADLILESRHQE